MQNENSKRQEWLTREAMADVDADRVVDHKAVLAWAERLGTECPIAPPCPKTP